MGIIDRFNTLIYQNQMLVIPFTEFLQKCVVGLGMLAIIDFGWAYHTKARYFSLHGVWNIIITVLILPDLYKTMIDPLNALSPGYNFTRWPIVFVAILHVWHCVAYNGLTSDDYFHHIVFAGGLSTINFLWDWGYSTNFMLFFICGLPGGLDYLMLSAVKHGYLAKISEKRINQLLNIWCRGPGCIAAACLVWVNWMNGNADHIPVPIKLVTILLALTNGQYYSRRVVASWARHEDELARSQEHSYCSHCKRV